VQTFKKFSAAATLAGSVLGLSLAAGPAVAQSIPLSPVAQAAGAVVTVEQGIEFVTVGRPGNVPYSGPGLTSGRGSVGYEYRIGRYEVTTSQWVEFFNAAFDRPTTDRLPHLIPPSLWGAQTATPTVPGGRRWAVAPGGENRFVGNISWRMAAMYCNWLHNGKSSDRAAFLSGAYDVSTFGYTDLSNRTFTDQAARSPGARFFIPTLDEWMKAAHYDPNKARPGQGGWWAYSITSDTQPVYGPPGFTVNGLATQANANWDDRQFPAASETVLLGAYPTVQSPWGLLDVAGATSEWTESIYAPPGNPLNRYFDGSSILDFWSSSMVGTDHVRSAGAEYPDMSLFDYGFRVAAVVPAPSYGLLVGVGVFVLGRRRRTRRVMC
jgi:formylglycine-generating enzyme required for sulfatase activity